MLALLGSIVGIAGRLFTAPATGAVGVLGDIAKGLGLRFYAGLAVGLIITDNHVRTDAIDLGKAIIGAVL